MNFNFDFLINPIAVVEMLAAGYLLAVLLQMGLTYLYTRLGPRVLLNEDRWSLAYFGMAGVSWIIAVAVAVFATLPITEVWSRHDANKVSLGLIALLILLVYRNRSQRPHQQPVLALMVFVLCISGGAWLGIQLWAKQHHAY